MAFIFLFTSCSKDDMVNTDQADFSIDLNLANQTDWPLADEILTLVNEHRVSMGLDAIKSDHQYASAYAVEHTQYMIEMRQINHDNFGIRSKALMDKGAVNVGENVAFGYSTAQEVVSAWLNSPGHRSIMEGNFNYSGFGVMKDTKGSFYFTQLFYRK